MTFREVVDKIVEPFQVAVVERLQGWWEIFVYHVENNPSRIYLVVIVVIFSGLSVYVYQHVANIDLHPRRREQTNYGSVQNYGYSYRAHLHSRREQMNYGNVQNYGSLYRPHLHPRREQTNYGNVQNYGSLYRPQQSVIQHPIDHNNQPSAIKSKGNSYQPKNTGRIYPQLDETIQPSGNKKKKKKTAADFPRPNVAFYSNLVASEPDGDYIEKILTSWKGDYDKLEKHHGYIQWLFPNPDMGVNDKAFPLKDEEAKIIRESPELKTRVKRAFEMMLDFYGMELTEENQFVLANNSTERLKELNQWNNHNFLRISRILLALKLLGHNDLVLPWMKFLATLIYVEKVLDKAANSFERHWITKLDAEDEINLNKYIKSVK